jgi:Flp pilus assembly protein TadD
MEPEAGYPFEANRPEGLQPAVRSLQSGSVRTTLALALMVASAGAACRREPQLSDEAYRQAVVAFHTGLAALQTSQEVLARRELERVTTLAPHEPAAWADIGLLLLRQQELDAAVERLGQAAELAPRDPDIQRLLGLAESRRGNLAEAVRRWRRALELRPDDAKAAYALALDLERQNDPQLLQEAQRTLDALARRSGNVVAQVEYVRIAAKRHDADAVRQGVAALASTAATWPDDIRDRFRVVQDAARSNPRAAGAAIAFLKNVLMRLPDYRRWLAALSTPREEVGEPIDRFLVLPNPQPTPAAADDSLTFQVQPAAASAAGPGTATDTWVGAVTLEAEGRPVIAAFEGTTLRIAGRVAWTRAGKSAFSAAPMPRANVVLAADLNYDFRTDFVVSSPGGLALLRQRPDGTFADVTTAARLPRDLLSTPAVGLWAADIDTDGDLDIVAAASGAPVRVLRNNGDDTLTVQQPFGPVASVRDFVWADLDGDGVPDAALIDDAGVTQVFVNARGGSFRRQTLPGSFPNAVAIAAAELTNDAQMDLVVLSRTGEVSSLSQAPDRASWSARAVTRLPSLPGGLTPGTPGLLSGDLDNNGASDIVVATPASSFVLLRGPSAVRPVTPPVSLDVRATADMDGDGRLDLIGLLPDGRSGTATSRGGRRYGWQTLRARAATATGDQRINSFGIGGEVEVRTGLHMQKQIIDSPLVHVGLGEAKQTEVVRILWPNGTIQSEFNIPANAAIPAAQRLKGSCPWLFAWNGREMAFVTDVLWRSPLGLRINAQETANVATTEDWVRVRGDQLTPRDGWYDLRITAELWETHFFDLASLLVVDHPAGTEVFVDERFVVPPPRLGVTITGPVQPVAAGRDDRGNDVSAVVRDRDDRHLDFAGRGRYQGVTRDHFVEVELPAGAPRTGPLWLVAQGWIHPTDSSINVALGQGAHNRPRGLSLQIADREGRFRTVRENLGFPAGKDKTVLLDLGGVFATGAPRRLRLSTNMEIFWDRIGWAVGRPDVTVEERRLAPGSARLRYRGYSRVDQPEASVPERPRYLLDGTMPRWRDLEGYYTRFGDVRDLLLGVDDRYVIMNAGDELQLRFAAAQPPAAGTVRDFVVITDGWEKDGDFNTTFSRTVLPLPTHAIARYDRAPERLEDDPIYRRYPNDFAEYHTRYVTPDAVRDSLRPPRDVGR